MDSSLAEIVVPIFVALLLIVWNLHRESRKIREDTARLVERGLGQLRAEFAEHQRSTKRNHKATQKQLGRLGELLADAREQPAGIEGHLRIRPAEPPDTSAGDSPPGRQHHPSERSDG